MTKSSLILKAIRFAARMHQGQKRKVSGDEYLVHPMAVSYIVASVKKSTHLDEIIAACWLHDVLEDSSADFVDLAKKFTPLVASLTQELTSDPEVIAKLGKMEYLKKRFIGYSSYALIIKLADRLHNVSDSPSEKVVWDTFEILEYLEKNRKLTAPQKELVLQLRQKITEFRDKKFGAS